MTQRAPEHFSFFQFLMSKIGKAKKQKGVSDLMLPSLLLLSSCTCQSHTSASTTYTNHMYYSGGVVNSCACRCQACNFHGCAWSTLATCSHSNVLMWSYLHSKFNIKEPKHLNLNRNLRKYDFSNLCCKMKFLTLLFLVRLLVPRVHYVP